MTLDTSPPPAPPSPKATDSAMFGRTLIAFLAGFGLPVLACYGFIIVAALALQILALGGSTRGLGTAESGIGPAVAVIRLEGVITSGQGTPFDTNVIAYSKDIITSIEEAGEDDQVKAVVLAVNSPGGGVVASDEIYHALAQVDKPVVVVISDLGASGAYYISMASDYIIANPGSLVGSIGVISEFPNAEGLLEKVGVDFVVITSGPRKDLGSPYREMTEDEQQYWQDMIDEIYEGFVEIVAKGRNMPVDEVRPLADGGVYTGRQALQLKLIDALGYEADAIAKAAELGGIAGTPRIIEYTPQPTLFELLSGASARPALLPSLAEIMNLVGHPTVSAQWIGQ